MYRYEYGAYYLRPVEEDDALLVTRWRNTKEARAAFFSGDEVVTPDTHAEFCRTRQPHDLVWLVGMHRAAAPGNEDMPVGMASLTVDVMNKSARFGRLVVSPELAGRGVAEKIVKLALAFAWDVLNLEYVNLEVYADNDSALALYKRVGFDFEVPRISYSSDGREVVNMFVVRPEVMAYV